MHRLKKIKCPLLFVVLVFIVVFLQLRTPYPLYQFSYFYNLLNSVYNSEFNKTYGEAQNGSRIIDCYYANYDNSENLITICFDIYDESYMYIFSRVAIEIESYMNNSEKLHMSNYKIDIELRCMGGLGVSLKNYYESEINNKFSYCYITDLSCSSLSDLKYYEWVEILDIGNTINIDDIDVFLDLHQLKKVKCKKDLFTSLQIKNISNKSPNISFEFFN